MGYIKMVQSINTKVDLVQKSTSLSGMTEYGKIMVGDKGFEFFDDRNVENFIQIPWTEVNHVAASVYGKKGRIPRYAIITHANGSFAFSSKDNKAVLRAIREYIGADNIRKSLTFFQVAKRGIKNIPASFRNLKENGVKFNFKKKR
jgi:hypothetical protein